MEFEFTRDELKQFEEMSNFIDEAIVKIDKEGIKAIASDSSMVCVYSLNIPFNKERMKNHTIEKPAEIGLNLKDFVQVFRRCKAYGSINFTLDKNTLTISDEEKTFRLSAIHINENEIPEIKNIKYGTEFELNISDLKARVRDSEAINGDTLKLSATKKGLEVVSDGITKQMSALLKATTKGIAKATYPLDYLNRIKNESMNAKVEFGNDSPMRITFSNGNWLILAPRVSEETEEVEEYE